MRHVAELASGDVIDETEWWNGWALFFMVFAALYILLALSSFPFVWYRSGIPILFLVLIVLFPPSFIFLFFYLVLLRFGLMTTWWYADPDRPAPAIIVLDDVPVRTTTSVVRREREMASRRV